MQIILFLIYAVACFAILSYSMCLEVNTVFIYLINPQLERLRDPAMELIQDTYQ